MIDFLFGDPIRATLAETYRNQKGNCEIKCADGTLVIDQVTLAMTSDYFGQMIEQAQPVGGGPLVLDQTPFSKGIVKVEHFFASMQK